MDRPDEVRTLLLQLGSRDREKRNELLRSGELFEGYNPEMERVHLENARALEPLLDDHGWPTRSRVGAEASSCAWTVALHAISWPTFQRRCRSLLAQAVEQGEAEAWQLATLEDRIRYNERRPQRYGTLFDWDEHGRMSPWPIEDPDAVEDRRARVGLPPLAETIERTRARSRREGARPPVDHAQRQAEIEAWARRVGWLEAPAGTS